MPAIRQSAIGTPVPARARSRNKVAARSAASIVSGRAGIAPSKSRVACSPRLPRAPASNSNREMTVVLNPPCRSSRAMRLAAGSRAGSRSVHRCPRRSPPVFPEVSCGGEHGLGVLLADRATKRQSPAPGFVQSAGSLQVGVEGLLDDSGKAFFATPSCQLEEADPLFIGDFDRSPHDFSLTCMCMPGQPPFLPGRPRSGGTSGGGCGAWAARGLFHPTGSARRNNSPGIPSVVFTARASILRRSPVGPSIWVPSSGKPWPMRSCPRGRLVALAPSGGKVHLVVTSEPKEVRGRSGGS
jgi:hypothetical protein